MKTFALLAPHHDAEIITDSEYQERLFHEDGVDIYHPLTLAPMRYRAEHTFPGSFALKRGYGDRDGNWGQEHLMHDVARVALLSKKELHLSFPDTGTYTMRFTEMKTEFRLKYGSTKSCPLDLYGILAPDSDLFHELQGVLVIEVVAFDPVGTMKQRLLVEHGRAAVELQVPLSLCGDDYGKCFDGVELRQLRSTLCDLFSRVLPVTVLNLPGGMQTIKEVTPKICRVEVATPPAGF